MCKLPKMSKFPVLIPAELHRAFKMKCAAEGVLMSEVIREWLRRECEAPGKPKPAKPAKLEKAAA